MSENRVGVYGSVGARKHFHTSTPPYPHTLILLALLLLVNLFVTTAIAAAHLEPFADLATYYQEAQMIAQGKGFTQPIKINVHAAATTAPFPTSDRFIYPMVVALAVKLFGDSLSVANVVSAVAMCLTMLPIYWLGALLFDWRAGFVAALLFALNPFYHIVGIGGWTDLTATLFYYACLWVVVSYATTDCRPPTADGNRQSAVNRRSSVSAWLAGLFCALAALTREDAIVLASLLIAAWWWRGHSWRDAVAFAAAPLALFALRALYLWQTFGSPLYSERTYTLLPRWALWYYLGVFSPADYLDYVGGVGGAVAIRVYNYTRFIENLFSDGIVYFTQTGLMPLVMLVAVAAAYRWRTNPMRRKVLLSLSGLMAAQFLLGIGYPGYAGNSTEVRHGQLIAPFLLLLAGAGLVWLWDNSPSPVKRPALREVTQGERGGGGGNWQRVLALALAGTYLVFALAYLGVWGQALLRPMYRGPIVLAAEWAGAHLPADAILMTRSAAETHYFSRRVVVVTPSAPFADMMAYARAHRISHFIITDVERNGAPNLLQGIRAFPQNFQVVYSTDGAQIVALKSYDFSAPLTLTNELYAGKNIGRPARLFDWNTLRPINAGVIGEQLTSAWSELFAAALHPPAPSSPRQQTLNLRAGESIALAHYALANAALRPGDELQLSLHWRALAATQSNYTVFVHLLDAAGVLRAQKDAPPLDGARPTSAWTIDEWIEDHYSFSLPDDLSSGVYQLEVGLYDSANGARLPLRDANGARLADDRLLIDGVRVR